MGVLIRELRVHWRHAVASPTRGMGLSRRTRGMGRSRARACKHRGLSRGPDPHGECEVQSLADGGLSSAERQEVEEFALELR